MLINLEKLLKTPVVQEPWEHQIVEGFFTDEAFSIIKNELVSMIPTLKELPYNNNGWWIHELLNYGMSKDVADLIMEANKELFTVVEQWLELYKNPQRSKIGYYSIPRISYASPGQGIVEMHDDAEKGDKTMVSVVYIYPENNKGTRMYKTNSANSFHGEAMFKGNNALVFAPARNVTWHDAEINNSERIVLGLYYEPLEKSYYVNNYNEEKLTWFYEEMIKDRIHKEL